MRFRRGRRCRVEVGKSKGRGPASSKAALAPLEEPALPFKWPPNAPAAAPTYMLNPDNRNLTTLPSIILTHHLPDGDEQRGNGWPDHEATKAEIRDAPEGREQH